jgi:hypothetical protein
MSALHLDAPVVGTRTIALDVDLVLIGQGLRAGVRPGARVVAAATRAVEQGSEFVLPRFIRSAVPVVRRTAARVELPSVALEGEAIARAMEGAAAVVAVVCTIGPTLDHRVSALLGVDPLLALAFDGLGSVSCERLSAEVCGEIEREARAEGNCVTGPLSPGMIGWPLADAQRQLFALVDPAPLGVVLMPSGQMIPRKTQSFVVGVGPRVRTQASCPACGIGSRCKYRPDHA